MTLPENRSPLSMGEKKSLFLIALRELEGNVTLACQIAKLGRSTYYNWMNDDEEFADAVKLISLECTEELLDRAETVLKFALRDPKSSTSTAKWLLARLGKQRGYGAKVQVEHSGDGNFYKQEYPDTAQSAEEWEADDEATENATVH